MILLMLITVVRVFMTNPVTKRCRAINFPVQTKQNKLQAKGGRQVNNNKYNYGKFSSNISLNACTFRADGPGSTFG